MNFPMKSVMDKIRSLIFLFLMVGSLLAFSKEIPTKPEGHDRFVNDYARMLSPDQVRALNNKLYGYWDSTSTEIVIVIENDLGDDELFEYSQKLAQGWGIGQKGKNNGLLIYVVVVVLEAAAEVVASAVVLEVEVSVGVAQAETGSVC